MLWPFAPFRKIGLTTGSPLAQAQANPQALQSPVLAPSWQLEVTA